MSANNGAAPMSAAEIEAEIVARRQHLAATVDELVTRAQPKAIAQRSVNDAKQRFAAFTRTETGELRTERLAAIGAAAVAVLTVIRLIRRASDRRRAGRSDD